MRVRELIRRLGQFDMTAEVLIEMRHQDLDPGETLAIDVGDVVEGATRSPTVVIKAAP